jgi:hypothetical protein
MRTAMPRSLDLHVAGLGALTLRVEPPVRVEFRDGGVEAEPVFTLEEVLVTSPVRVRYVPQVGRRDGVVQLVAESAVPAAALPVPVDLAPLLPPVELPRTFSWSLRGMAGEPVRVRCLVQGVEVGDERLVVQLGFAPGS